MNSIKVGLLGFGTIGAGVVKAFQQNGELLARRLGGPVELVRIADLDGDGRADLARIDTARCKVALLTGEYDYSCTPEMTEAVAAAGRLLFRASRARGAAGHGQARRDRARPRRFLDRPARFAARLHRQSSRTGRDVPGIIVRRGCAS